MGDLLIDILGFGVSSTSFSLTNPQKLARGRESWIEELYDIHKSRRNNTANNTDNNIESEELYEDIYRLVLCGAKFQNSSAAQSMRGLEQIGIDIGELLFALYADKRLVVYAEDVTQAPIGTTGVEWYRISKPFGVLQIWHCRWEMECHSSEDINRALQMGGSVVVVEPKQRNTTYISKGELPPEYESEEQASVLSDFLRQHLYLMHTPKLQQARYRAREMHYILQDAEAIVLFHKDRNGHACAIYSKKPQDKETVLRNYAEKSKFIYIPFLIPGFLARWDRAIADLYENWNQEIEFPIPIVKGRWLDPDKMQGDQSREDQSREDQSREEMSDADSGEESSISDGEEFENEEFENEEGEHSESEGSDMFESQEDSESFELNFMHEDEFQKTMGNRSDKPSEPIFTDDFEEPESEEESW